MNCCGCDMGAGLFGATNPKPLEPCWTSYKFVTNGDSDTLYVPQTAYYEVSISGIGGDINKAKERAPGTGFAIVRLIAGAPITVRYGDSTTLTQGDVAVQTSGTGTTDYRPGAKIRYVGAEWSSRKAEIITFDRALQVASAWRDWTFSNGQNMRFMSNNSAMVPVESGSWTNYPAGRQFWFVADVMFEETGEHFIAGIGDDVVRIMVDGQPVVWGPMNPEGVFHPKAHQEGRVNIAVAGKHQVLYWNANSDDRGRSSPVFSTLSIMTPSGKYIGQPNNADWRVFESTDDCSKQDMTPPTMTCWSFNVDALNESGINNFIVPVDGWYRIIVASGGQPLDGVMENNKGQGVIITELKAGETINFNLLSPARATLPNNRVVEAAAGSGMGRAGILYLAKNKQLKDTHSTSLASRPSWNGASPPESYKISSVVSGFPDMAHVPGNTAEYLIGRVTLEQGKYKFSTWGDDIAVVFFDGRHVVTSDGATGWDQKEFDVMFSGEHQIFIYNKNIPHNTPGWACLTIQDMSGNVVHEINTTDYKAIDTVYDCTGG